MLSVIVVAYNNENHIQRALRSCLSHKFSNIEVLVVYNNSCDDTLAAIETIKDDRVRLIINDENVGLGEARNIGMRNAIGSHLIFLDGDDFYFPGAIEYLVNIIEDSTWDILMFDYKRYYENGALIGNKKKYLLKECVYPRNASRKKLFRNFNVAWNKVYRKEFIKKINVEFALGFYEDIDWNVKCLSLANVVYVVPHALIAYRQRSGSILRSRNSGHLDALKRQEATFEFLMSNPEISKLYASEIFLQARSQIYNVVRDGTRLPKSDVPGYLKGANSLMGRYRDKFELPSRGFIEKAASLESYYVLNAADYIKRIVSKNKVRNLFVKVKKRLKVALYRGVFIRLPVSRRKFVYSSYWGQKIDCNPLAIYEEVKSRGGYDNVWIVKKGAVNPEDYPDVKLCFNNSILALWHLATARYLINNANFPDYFIKRKEAVFVQTKHGTPLKYMGLDIRPVSPTHMNWTRFKNRCLNWDYVISSNTYSTEKWRQGFPYHYKVLEMGYPRNDILKKEPSSELLANIKNRLGVSSDKKIVLYAPTFRDDQQNVDINEGEMFDPYAVQKAFGNDYVVLTRGHYFNIEPVSSNSDYCIDASDYSNSAELLLVTDVLITDYSSIAFDYLNLNRPIILYCYDISKYTSSRGCYINYKESSPGVLVESRNELVQVIKNEVYCSEGAKAKRDRFAYQLGMLDDGNASKNIVNEIIS